MSARFGPAGNGDLFYKMGYKSSIEAPEFLNSIGLNAYEFQCGRGVNIGEQTAKKLGENARKYDVTLSIHAPYYISLASPKVETRENSIRYITESAIAARNMGAERVIIHPGGTKPYTQEEAFSIATETLKRTLVELDNLGLSDIRICPETMGKSALLGSLEQVLDFCLLDERFIPCIDFGHLNARNMGALKEFEDFSAIFDKIENALGASRLREIHIHFSKIEYTQGGERRHLTFEDDIFGPDFEPVIELIAKKSLSPVIICESAGTQADDAVTMAKFYKALQNIQATKDNTN